MNNGYIVVSSVGLAALGYTLVNYLRSLVNIGNRDARSAFIAQTISYVTFVALTFLAAAASTTFGTVAFVPGVTLSNMDSASKVMVGLVLGGGAGAFTKFLQARDGTDSAATPSFLPPAQPPGD